MARAEMVETPPKWPVFQVLKQYVENKNTKKVLLFHTLPAKIHSIRSSCVLLQENVVFEHWHKVMILA